jgi:hypothetical protein
MQDLLDALPRPPLEDLGEHLVHRDRVCRHAEKLLTNGILAGISVGDLRDALGRAWLLYVQGRAITDKLKTQHRDILLPAAKLPRLALYGDITAQRRSSRKRARAVSKRWLASPPRKRPKQFGEHAFIQAMHIIWERHSAERRKGWTASGYRGVDDSKRGPDGKWRTGADGPFQRFVNDWLLAIDPGRPPPSRHLYAATKRRMQKPAT